MFILGDARNSSDSTSRRRRSTSRDYYNGPLEPGASYSIFQRIFINKEVQGSYLKGYSVLVRVEIITQVEILTGNS